MSEQINAIIPAILGLVISGLWLAYKLGIFRYVKKINDKKEIIWSSFFFLASPFITGNAMGRNKYIYALADYALVVSSAYEKGGTWAGAKEALEKIKDVPVFVRMQDTVCISCRGKFIESR